MPSLQCDSICTTNKSSRNASTTAWFPSSTHIGLWDDESKNHPKLPRHISGKILASAQQIGLIETSTCTATVTVQAMPRFILILPSTPTESHSTSFIILPSIGSETTSSSAFSIDRGRSNSSMVQGGYELIRLLSQGIELGNHQGFFTTRHCSTHLASQRCWGSWFQISGSMKNRVLVPLSGIRILPVSQFYYIQVLFCCIQVSTLLLFAVTSATFQLALKWLRPLRMTCSSWKAENNMEIIKMQYARLGSCRNNMVTMKWHSCKSQFSFFHHSERGLQIPVSPSMRRPSLQVPNASSIFNYILGFRHRNQNLCIPRLRNRFFRSKFSLPQLNHSEAFCGLDARPN